MNRILTIAVSILFMFALAGFAFFFTPNEPQAPIENSPQTSLYQDSVHGYSFSYPAGLSVLEYTDDMIAVGNLIEGGIDATTEVRVADISGMPGESLTDAVARELRNLCAADGPGGSFSCTGIESAEQVVSASGAEGVLIYLEGELRSLPEGDVTMVPKGPYYVFPLKSGATGSRVLVVHAPFNRSASEADADLISMIALSVSLPAEAR